jgi:regulator of protease activity HflC (stomatin/prohibitin superfamily)
MDSALAWIGQLAEWVGRFFPRRVILDTTEGAVKYHGGKTPVVCGPGIHWYWPWRSTWMPYPTARQTDRLETQTMESKDGKTFIVSAMVTYGVTDIIALVTTTHSPSTAVIDMAMAAVHDVCCEMDWTDLQNEQRKGTLKTKLKNEAQKQLKDYGVTVIKLQLNSIARARVLKISQSTASEEN